MTAEQGQRSVLVCDGDPRSVRGLRNVLRDAGFSVSSCHTTGEALTRAALRVPDAAIVEMTLTEFSGTELCRRLRAWSSMPLIILSQVTDEDRMVDAFEAGADDYIIKPFRPRELVARLTAHLERAAAQPAEPVVHYRGLEIDLAARVVCRDGHEVRLTPIEYKLLSTLVRNRGRLLTHDVLLRSIWGAAYADDHQTLRAHIANLRRKLASSSSSGLIRTYPGVGYLLEGTADSSEAVPPASSRPLGMIRAA
jgi:two-component system, OmpR family, KDP operon response regulator KdpE